MKKLTWVLVVSLLAGCGPDKVPPVQMMVMMLSPKGVYEPKRAALGSLTNVSAFSGSVATLVGGSRIIIDPGDPALAAAPNLTDEQLANVFVKAKGIPPRGSYVENNGVLWPADFHTWNMATTYYNFEKAFEYFQAIGLKTEEVGTSTVYYFPYYVALELGTNPIEDNALFFSPIRAFAVLPFNRLQTVPLSMNYGVIAHEYSHRVFNLRTYQGKSIPEPIVRWAGFTVSPGVNLLKSMDEGLADWNAYGATCISEYGCNPRFLGASLSQTETDLRDLSKPDKCLTAAMKKNIDQLSASDFSRQGFEYRVGTVLASALYHAAAKTGQRQVLQASVLSAYSDTSPATPGFAQLVVNNLTTPEGFNLPAVANSILQHITDPTLKKETCSQFMDRLKIKKEDMKDCPTSTIVDKAACPDL
ncbi:MAG TPA: hypothetical protein VK447_06695 [Myxococcaceae bacterium]|nr:hypothetical protein [Myxococcaceae bacterium]